MGRVETVYCSHLMDTEGKHARSGVKIGNCLLVGYHNCDGLWCLRCQWDSRTGFWMIKWEKTLDWECVNPISNRSSPLHQLWDFGQVNFPFSEPELSSL